MKKHLWRSVSALVLPTALLLSPALAGAPDKAPAIKAASTRMASGQGHWLAIKPDGGLWAWGANDDGLLGIGTSDFDNRTAPVRLGLKTDWVAVSAGSKHTAALKSDGSLWTWGVNNCGQLGYDTKKDNEYGTSVSKPQLTPLRVDQDSTWAAVSAGGNHTVALKKDGSLWAWGLNERGQLGDGSKTMRETPVRIGEESNWTAVSARVDYTLALKADGSLWAWGANDSGQLGDGTDDSRSAPIRVGADSDWAAVSAGWEHTVAMKADGSIWAWGKNQQGQLGYDTEREFNLRKAQLTPRRVGTDSDWAVVSAGGDHTVALKGDGSLWAWGSNVGGQLDGKISDTKSQASPVRIGAEANWVAVSASNGRTVAMKADGSIWGWGDPDPYFKNPTRAATTKIMAAGSAPAPKQGTAPTKKK